MKMKMKMIMMIKISNTKNEKILFLLLIFSLLILSSCTSQIKEDCSQDIYDCNDFSTHGEAQELYELCGGVENDIHWLDGNKDGEACESSPLIDKKITIGIIILAILGLIIFGVKIVKKLNKLDKKEIKEKLKELSPFEKRYNKGLEFEHYVLSLFPEDKWSIVDYTKDLMKGSNRRIETSSNPDFVLRNKKTKKCYAIECKYRNNYKFSNYFNEKGLTLLKRHLESYKEFSKNNDCSVYILFGLGGNPKNPDKMFLIPLNKVNLFMSEKFLKDYGFNGDLK